jgi:hypothetical protein
VPCYGLVWWYLGSQVPMLSDRTLSTALIIFIRFTDMVEMTYRLQRV